MPIFNLQFDEAYPAHPAPIVTVEFAKAKKGAVFTAWETVRLDTGADITTIPPELAEKLKVHDNDVVENMEHGGQTCPVIYVDLVVAGLPRLTAIRTLVFDLGNPYALLGTNVLSRWSFLAFSWPLNTFIVDPAPWKRTA